MRRPPCSTRRPRSLVVLSPGAGRPVGGHRRSRSTGPPRTVPLPGAATAMTGDNEGRVYVSTRGGYFRCRRRRRHVDPGRRRRPAGDRLHRDRPPRRRQAGARQRRRRGLHAELRHRGRRAAEDLRPRGCPCHTREYGRRAGPRADVGDHHRRQRSRRRACAAGRRGSDHDGGRFGRPGAGRRHPRRRAAGVRHRPADPASALPGARRPVRAGRVVRGWPGCRRRRPTPWLVTIWPPVYPSRRCVIEPCSNRTPWPSTKRLAPCMWCRARERVCR